ncbi:MULTISPECIES: hypothetical protein [Mesorhizobium]|uniref:hypothetical protein n=1 Tax=Mesorhizobium TaxID=68287 RepID=UPI0012EBBB9A|nr:hypothetical protein [Mesorhizobium sp. LNHC229A00]
MNMMISLLGLERRAIRLLMICRCGKEKGSTGFLIFFEVAGIRCLKGAATLAGVDHPFRRFRHLAPIGHRP